MAVRHLVSKASICPTFTFSELPVKAANIIRQKINKPQKGTAKKPMARPEGTIASYTDGRNHLPFLTLTPETGVGARRKYFSFLGIATQNLSHWLKPGVSAGDNVATIQRLKGKEPQERQGGVLCWPLLPCDPILLLPLPTVASGSLFSRHLPLVCPGAVLSLAKHLSWLMTRSPPPRTEAAAPGSLALLSVSLKAKGHGERAHRKASSGVSDSMCLYPEIERLHEEPTIWPLCSTTTLSRQIEQSSLTVISLSPLLPKSLALAALSLASLKETAGNWPRIPTLSCPHLWLLCLHDLFPLGKTSR
jgi:hypothetical protein